MVTRRDFLRSAGGVTVLALTPVGRGLFAAPASFDGPRLPLFTVLPYIQPGSGSRLKQGHESMVVAWQTYEARANFSVDFGPTKSYGRTANCASSGRAAGHGGDSESRLNWIATMDGLGLGEKCFYRVRG